ncbi:MAG: isoaspartyl peptidase/L-asparaginase [Promethearchaeota archaeon]
MGLPMIITHGGAGNWKDEKIPIGIEHVEEAARIGFRVLVRKGSALDAAEACTLYMESCGKLNAGLGATKNSDNERELDAIIVDGSQQNFGAVAAIRGIQNPISLARYILEKTDYCFFAGENAQRIYRMMIEEGYREEQESGVVSPPCLVQDGDTVGCIAIDTAGRIASTSSTGGIRGKLPGRVGDSPVMGAGAFANSIGGASATGYGEHIMRVTMSRMAVLYIEEGLDPQVSAEKAMALLEIKTGSEAGIVTADAMGNWGKATNAKAMPTVVIQEDLESLESFIR